MLTLSSWNISRDIPLPLALLNRKQSFLLSYIFLFHGKIQEEVEFMPQQLCIVEWNRHEAAIVAMQKRIRRHVGMKTRVWRYRDAAEWYPGKKKLNKNDFKKVLPALFFNEKLLIVHR